MHTDEPERGEAYGCSHVTDLAVLAFNERELYPASGDVCAETHGRSAVPNPVRGFDNFSFAGLGVVALDVYAFGEPTDGFFGDLTVHLREVCARVLVFRVQKFFDELAVISQEQSAFAIMVEATCGVHSWRKSEAIEGGVARFGGELAQNTKRLIENNNGRHAPK